MQLTKNQTYHLPVENKGGLEDFLTDLSVLEISIPELLHSVVTSTFPLSRVFSGFTRKRKGELIQKCALVEASLEEKQGGFGKAQTIQFLDSVEKSVVSYYLGIILTKVVAKRIFDVDYVTHLQLIKDKGGSYFGYIDKKRRSELIGAQPGIGYSVFSAKGRSNNSMEALEEGAAQVEEIASVNGKTPSVRAVAMTYYEKGILSIRLKEPKKPGKSRIDFTEKDYLKAYYTPIRELFFEFYNTEAMKDIRIGGVDMVEAEIVIPYFFEEQSEDQHMRSFVIGMPRELAEQGLSTFAEIPPSWSYLKEKTQALYGKDCYMGGDFVYVRLN